MPKFRFNHMELSFAKGTLTQQFRDEVDAFYGDVLGWRTLDTEVIGQLCHLLLPDDGQFILLAEGKDPLSSPGLSAAGEGAARLVDEPDPGRAQVHAVAVAALHHFGVARHDLPRRRPGRGGRDRLHLGLQQIGRGEALLEHHRERQRERPRACHGEVVDGAVHGQIADRAARKAERPDDEAVRRECRVTRRRRRPGRHRRARPARPIRTPARAGPRSASATPCRRRRAPW